MTIDLGSLLFILLVLVPCWVVSQYVGWLPVLVVLVLAAVLLAVLLVVLAIANNRFFDNAQRRAAENYRLETEAQRVKALREIGRLQAHTKRSLPEKALFGRN